MERDVGGGIGMGNTCKPMAVSFQCMAKFTTNKKKKKRKKVIPLTRAIENNKILRNKFNQEGKRPDFLFDFVLVWCFGVWGGRWLGFLFFWPCHRAYGILVSRPGIEPWCSSVKALNPNH